MFYSKLCFITLIVITFICCSIPSESVKVAPCSDDIPTAVNFVSEGCNEAPCPLVKNTNSNANITFRIPSDTETGEIQIKAKVDNINFWVTYPAADKNVCHNLIDTYCPLDENEIVTYHLAIPVLKVYPTGLGLELKISFLDDKKKTMMCMQIKCQVVAE